MKPVYWLSQTKGEPLFPNLEWSRPENRQQAGKLLVVGGHLHGFAAPAEAYGEALRAGVGTVRALLPESIRKIVGAIIPEADFAPCTPSGSFNQKAVAELLAASAWADGVLFPGDLGRNSETAIMVETFLSKYTGQVTFTRDAVDYIVSAPQNVLSRPETLLVLSLAQLQRLGIAAAFPLPVTFSMDLLHIVAWLHDFTTAHKLSIIVKHLDHILVAVNGTISSTKVSDPKAIWRVKTAARASVWWLQHPGKPFESLTTSLLA